METTWAVWSLPPGPSSEALRSERSHSGCTDLQCGSLGPDREARLGEREGGPQQETEEPPWGVLQEKRPGVLGKQRRHSEGQQQVWSGCEGMNPRPAPPRVSSTGRCGTGSSAGTQEGHVRPPPAPCPFIPEVPAAPSHPGWEEWEILLRLELGPGGLGLGWGAQAAWGHGGQARPRIPFSSPHCTSSHPSCASPYHPGPRGLPEVSASTFPRLRPNHTGWALPNCVTFRKLCTLSVPQAPSPGEWSWQWFLHPRAVWSLGPRSPGSSSLLMSHAHAHSRAHPWGTGEPYSRRHMPEG